MAFLWDPAKAQDNFRKHHILFDDAEYAFDDPLRMIRRDNDSSEDEERWQTIRNAMGQLLFVVYTYAGDNDTRLISARLAMPKERRTYYGDSKTHSQDWFRVNF
jgi:uncharacterized DUF497 family protein